MKCIPINLSGLFDAESSVIEIDDVLVANIDSGLIISFNLLKIDNLASLFSYIASIIRLTSFGVFSTPVIGTILSRMDFLFSSVIISFFICLSRFLDIVSIALSSNSVFSSMRLTRKPFCANTCEIPLPIVPPPMTAIDLISIIKFPLIIIFDNYCGSFPTANT